MGTASRAGTKIILVTGVEGFSTGQTITIGNGGNLEKAVVASIAAGRRRFGGRNMTPPSDTLAVTAPLKYSHAAGAQVSGSGITLSAPLTMAHDIGTQVAGNIPTPGKPNQYIRKPE